MPSGPPGRSPAPDPAEPVSCDLEREVDPRAPPHGPDAGPRADDARQEGRIPVRNGHSPCLRGEAELAEDAEGPGERRRVRGEEEVAVRGRDDESCLLGVKGLPKNNFLNSSALESCSSSVRAPDPAAA